MARFIGTAKACIALLATALLFVSCDHHTLTTTLDKASALAEHHPTRAIEVLQGIDRESIPNEALLAHYALVYSEACYYNRMLVNSDSLTRIAVAFYEGSSDHDKRARAYYQHGLIQSLANENPKAILSFSKAKESLAIDKNRRLEGLIYRAEGDIYRQNDLYPTSYASYEKALECFEELGLPYHTHYTMYNMGQVAIKTQNFATADSLFADALDYAIETHNLDFLCTVLHETCELYLFRGDKEQFIATVEMFETYDCALWLLSHYYSMKSIAHTFKGEFDEALEALTAAESQPNVDFMATERAKYYFNHHTGNDAEGSENLEHIIRRLVDVIITAAEQPVLTNQVALLKSTLIQEEREMQVIRIRIYAIATISLILAVAGSCYAVWRRRKLQADVQHYMDMVPELQLTRKDSNSEPLAKAVDRLYNDRLTVLNSLCETYYDHSDTSRQATKVFDQVRNTINTIKSDEATLAELESLVNDCRSELMAKLRAQCPKLNERELKVALYSFAGFSSRAISIFVDSNTVALSKMKYRIKSKIKESGARDAEIFISALNER